MCTRAALACVLMLLLVAGCDGSGSRQADDAGTVPSVQDEAGRPDDAQPVVVVQTPAGEAGMRLEVAPARIEPHEDVHIRLHNVGEVELLTGLDYAIERWEGSAWVQAFTPEVPAVGLVLGPGQSTPEGEIPTWPGQFRHEVSPEPGVHRVTKTASVEGDAVTTLSVDAIFEVVAGD